VEVDDLFAIIGPQVESSHDDSFIGGEEGGDHYDKSNMYNIFENQLRLKERPKLTENGKSE